MTVYTRTRATNNRLDRRDGTARVRDHAFRFSPPPPSPPAAAARGACRASEACLMLCNRPLARDHLETKLDPSVRAVAGRRAACRNAHTHGMMWRRCGAAARIVSAWLRPVRECGRHAMLSPCRPPCLVHLHVRTTTLIR
jgi:hypothetical protein